MAVGAQQSRRMREILDEDVKRLLAAILEFTAVIRRDEPSTENRDPGLGLGPALRRQGLGARHASALLTIALWGPMTVSDLARRHHVAVKTASLVAVELEQAGLIDRRPDPRDRRRTVLTVAAGKQRLVEQGLRRRAAPLRSTLDRLSRAEAHGLISGLEMLARAHRPAAGGKGVG